MQFSDIITFTRSSGGGRFNAQGQYEWLPANEPRIDYDPVTGECLGLLIEEQRTNLLLNSSKVSTALPTIDGVNPVFGAPQTIRGIEVEEVSDTSDTAMAGRMINNLTGYTSVTGSVYVKRKASTTTYPMLLIANVTSGTLCRAVIDPVNGTATLTSSAGSVSVEKIGDDLLRVSLSGTMLSSDTFYFGFFPAATSTSTGAVNEPSLTGTVHAGSLQLEAGSFPTSYIPTTTAQVTRAADIARVNELSPWYNPEAGTLFVEWVAVSYNNTPSPAAFMVGTGNNGFSINGSGVTRWWNGSSNVSALNNSPVGQTRKDAAAWSSAGRSVVHNGGAVGSDASLGVSGSPSALRIGAASITSQFVNGHIRSIRYFPRRLSNSELQALTA